MRTNHRTRASVFGPLISVLAVILGLGLVGPINPANADEGGDDCVPADAVPGRFSDWAFDSYTVWQTSSTAPADPDGQDGEDNPLNLIRLGARSQQTVEDSGSHFVYYTGSGDGSVREADALWSTSNPGGAWIQYDQRTVTDHSAYDETIVDSPAVPGQHYSLKGKAKTEKDGVPATPLVDPSIWQANAPQEPHLNGNGGKNVVWYPDPNATSGLHYTSHGSKGLRDWFYYTAPVPEVSHTVHHDAVTHQEYRFRKMVEGGSHTEYRWAIEKRNYTPGTDGNTCNPEVLPEDAAASVSTLPASCTGAGSLVLGDDIANATWGEPTIENNTFSVVATAATGHLFAAGDGVSGDQVTETFTGSLEPAFTQQQLEDSGCIEVEGEQTHGDHPGHNPGHHPGHQNTPEVKGEQAHAAPAAAAAAAVVPTEVEAGLAGTPARIPNHGTSNNLPLWALSLGAGMFLIGAGRLRRTGRTTR